MKDFFIKNNNKNTLITLYDIFLINYFTLIIYLFL